MGRKAKEVVEPVEKEQTQKIAAGKLYTTYSAFVDETTANWGQLALAMDAALSVRHESEQHADAAGVVIEGTAFSFLKDIDLLREFFMYVAGVEENEEFNFEPVAEEEEAGAAF